MQAIPRCKAHTHSHCCTMPSRSLSLPALQFCRPELQLACGRRRRRRRRRSERKRERERGTYLSAFPSPVATQTSKWLSAGRTDWSGGRPPRHGTSLTRLLGCCAVQRPANAVCLSATLHYTFSLGDMPLHRPTIYYHFNLILILFT